MVRFNTFVILPLALGAGAAELHIPSVDAAVLNALNDYGNYEAYDGPQKKPPQTANVTYDTLLADAPFFWLESISHQGISAFGPSGYQVFCNVKDFGAKGDGVTDDTAAINEAISGGNRCGQGCTTSTTTPALVYFSAGTYMVSYPIFDYYYTQTIGSPNDMPVIKGTSGFQGGYLIDADPYFTANLNWPSTVVFFRHIRNICS